MQAWYLEGYLNDENTLRRLPVNSFPFVVGRNSDVKLCIPTQDVSRCHAEIHHLDSSLMVRDLGSTNGTYVNGGRVESETALMEGDVIHFGYAEFRLIGEALDDGATMVMPCIQAEEPALPEKLMRGTRELHELIAQSRVSGVFQPIVNSQTELAVAYEMLGRGTHPELSPSPGALFFLAEHISSEVSLSELFRRACLEQAYARRPDGRIFFNIHPREAQDPDRLFKQMVRAREDYPELDLVLEVHEAAVTDLPVMRRIRDLLTELDIGLAYDDFGAGQARLLELADIPPDVLKFDMQLIRDIDKASDGRLRMVRMLLDYAHDFGTEVLAEGVETASEAEVCRELGFDLMQGYYYGKPSSDL